MLYCELDDNVKSEINNLGITLRNEFDENEKLRNTKENEWVQSLRQCKGQYDPEVDSLIPENASRIYVKYTRYKENTLRAILNNVIFPGNGKNWSIYPSTKPCLSQDVLDDINISIGEIKRNIAIESGQQISDNTQFRASKDELDRAVSEYAAIKCTAMEKQISDQLENIKYASVLKDVLKSGIRFGTGIAKGCFSEIVNEIDYQESMDGFKQVVVEKYNPSIDFVRIWDAYPDMSSVEMEDCEFFWERILLSKHQLKKISKRGDFFSDSIGRFIRENPNGNAKYKQWELDLEKIEAKTNNKTRNNKYELLSRWGYLSGDILSRIGIDIEDIDEMEDYLCNIFLLGNNIVKISKSPMNSMKNLSDIYHIFYFDKDETSFLGTGLPKIARDMELTMGASIRTALNNAAITCGPQLELNMDYIQPDEDPTMMHALKIWKRNGRGNSGAYPMIRPLEFNSRIPELLSIFDKALNIADLELCMPMWMHTEPERVNEQGMTQAAIKWQLQTITLKDILHSFDECNEGIIKSIYNWNMEFGDDSIKGDNVVKAVGSAYLLMRQINMQILNYFSQTLNEKEKLYINTGKFLRERMRMMLDTSTDEFVRTDEEVNEILRGQVDEENIKLMKEKIKSEIMYDLAKAAHMTAKADKTEKDSSLGIIEKMTSLGNIESETIR